MKWNYSNIILTLIFVVIVTICVRIYQFSPAMKDASTSEKEVMQKKLVITGTELLKDGSFEVEKDNMPAEWGTWSALDEKGVKFILDKTVKHSGGASACIINTDTDPEQKKLPQWVQHVESNLPYGQKVVLTGWVKSEEANAAAVCMRCDGQEKQLAFATTWNFKGPFKGTMDLDVF